MEKRMIVDVSGHENGSSLITQGIKLELTKWKQGSIIAVGKQKELTVLDGTKGVDIVSTYNEGDPEPTDPDHGYRRTIEVFLESQAPVLVSFAEKDKLYETAKEVLKPVDVPSYVTFFMTKTNNRFSFLGSTGVLKDPKPQEMVALLKEIIALAKKALFFTDISAAFVTGTGKEADLSSWEKETFDALRNEPEFKGLVSGGEVMEGKYDIYLCSATLGQVIEETIYSGYQMYKEKYDQYIKDDFKSRFAVHLGKKMVRFVNSTTQAFVRDYGSFLLGFDRLIIKTDPHCSLKGYQTALECAGYYINSLEEDTPTV